MLRASIKQTGRHILRSARWWTVSLALIGLGAILSGCSSAPEVSAPVDPPAAFSDEGSDTIEGTATVPDRWWTAFSDPALNAAVDSALSNNFTVRAAWERLKAADAVLDRESSLLYPQVDASSSIVTERRAEQAPGRQPGNEDISAGLSASYEIDLWGRIRAQRQAEQERVRATLADYRVATLTVSAEITRTWVQLAEAREQIDLVNQQIETNETVLQLLRDRFGTGQIQSVDILRQRQLIEATREEKAAAEAQERVLQNRLAVLVGRAPTNLQIDEPSALPDLPEAPDTGIPAELVERRPDVRAARFRLRASDRDLSAAISNRYPRLTLDASAFASAPTAQGLFDNWVATVGGNLLAPIFYGGELQAEVDRTEAVRNERIYLYGQAILQAFQDVEDALILETKQREQVQFIADQVDLAEQSYDQLRIQYLNGSGSYLDVLTALRDVQELRRELLLGRRLLAENRIALYRALAGSFETPRDIDAPES